MEFSNLFINLVWCFIFGMAILGFPVGCIYGRRRTLDEIELCDCDCHWSDDAPMPETVPAVVQSAQSRLDANDVLFAEVIE